MEIVTRTPFALDLDKRQNPQLQLLAEGHHFKMLQVGGVGLGGHTLIVAFDDPEALPRIQIPIGSPFALPLTRNGRGRRVFVGLYRNLDFTEVTAGDEGTTEQRVDFYLTEEGEGAALIGRTWPLGARVARISYSGTPANQTLETIFDSAGLTANDFMARQDGIALSMRLKLEGGAVGVGGTSTKYPWELRISGLGGAIEHTYVLPGHGQAEIVANLMNADGLVVNLYDPNAAGSPDNTPTVELELINGPVAPSCRYWMARKDTVTGTDAKFVFNFNVTIPGAADAAFTAYGDDAGVSGVRWTGYPYVPIGVGSGDGPALGSGVGFTLCEASAGNAAREDTKLAGHWAAWCHFSTTHTASKIIVASAGAGR